MNIAILLGIICFCCLGWGVSLALKATAVEARQVGDYLVAESQRVQAELDRQVREALATVKQPIETRIEIVDEPYEAPSGGRQLTEHELRGILYSAVGLVLDKKLDPAEVAVQLSQIMKQSFDIRVR